MLGNLAMEERDYTYEEYQEYCESHDGRFEFQDGEIIALASPTTKHQIAAGNIYGFLWSYLRGKSCKVFQELDVNLYANDRIIFCPDIQVVCDTTKIGSKHIKGAPDIVVEVLSPSTRGRDLLLKRDYYEHSGVKEYWIADPDSETIIQAIFEKCGKVELQYNQYDAQNYLLKTNILSDFKLDIREVFTN